MAAMTSALAAMTSDLAALPTDFAAQSILGCPISSFLALESACSITNLPSCADSSSLDKNCCGSLSAYESSAYNCYTDHSLACLNTADLQSYISSYHLTISSDDDPCGQYGAMTAPPAATGTGSTSNKKGETATSETQKTTATGSMTTSGTTTGSGTGSGTGSASSTAKKSAGNSMKTKGTAFKICLGLTIGAFVGFIL